MPEYQTEAGVLSDQEQGTEYLTEVGVYNEQPVPSAGANPWYYYVQAS